MRGLTGIAAPSHESTYLYICRPGSRVLHFVLAAAVGTKTKRPKRGRQQKEVEFVQVRVLTIDWIDKRSDAPWSGYE